LAATQLWADLELHAFWRDALADAAGDVPWDKVLQLLVVNRLLAPRSELFVHEKWFPQSAMDMLLDTDACVADSPREINAGLQVRDVRSPTSRGKDRLDRCLVSEHLQTIELHRF
jgi:hypothetical protein